MSNCYCHPGRAGGTPVGSGDAGGFYAGCDMLGKKAPGSDSCRHPHKMCLNEGKSHFARGIAPLNFPWSSNSIRVLLRTENPMMNQHGFRPLSACRARCLLRRTRPAGGNAILNCRALFVVVPCLDHHKWQKIVGRKILAPQT